MVRRRSTSFLHSVRFTCIFSHRYANRRFDCKTAAEASVRALLHTALPFPLSQPLRYVVLSTLRPGVIDTVRSAAVSSIDYVNDAARSAAVGSFSFHLFLFFADKTSSATFHMHLRNEMVWRRCIRFTKSKDHSKQFVFVFV